MLSSNTSEIEEGKHNYVKHECDLSLGNELIKENVLKEIVSLNNPIDPGEYFLKTSFLIRDHIIIFAESQTYLNMRAFYIFDLEKHIWSCGEITGFNEEKGRIRYASLCLYSQDKIMTYGSFREENKLEVPILGFFTLEILLSKKIVLAICLIIIKMMK